MPITTETRTVAGRAAKIAQLNDAHRRTLTDTVMTATIADLPHAQQAALLEAVAWFDRFDHGNDPYGEHDFGALTVAGERYF